MTSSSSNQTNKSSYHDYVIKDGKFIGEFEKMYKDFEDPWMQSNQPNPYSRAAGVSFIKKFGIKSILEMGSGMGYYADWIFRETGVKPISIDISPTAIEKGKQLFPDLDLRVGTISEIEKYEGVDAVYFPEIMWYILDELDSVNTKLLEFFQGKILVIVQVFYKGSQKYGNEFFTNQDELINYMPFKLLGRMQSTFHDESTIETATVFRIEKK